MNKKIKEFKDLKQDQPLIELLDKILDNRKSDPFIRKIKQINNENKRNT